MSFAQNLDYLMQKNRMSRYQLAKETGCHQTSITNWLDNGATPQRRTIEAVAAVFGLTPEEICADELPEVKKREKPTAEVSSELNDEGIKLAESLNSVANEMVDIIIAIKKDPLYRPEMVVKTVEVVCPLSGKIEKIEQSYVAHNGSRVPLPNNGCSQFSSCAECFMCQLRVMESVR